QRDALGAHEVEEGVGDGIVAGVAVGEDVGDLRIERVGRDGVTDGLEHGARGAAAGGVPADAEGAVTARHEDVMQGVTSASRCGLVAVGPLAEDLDALLDVTEEALALLGEGHAFLVELHGLLEGEVALLETLSDGFEALVEHLERLAV